jgi:hypothetical protein
MLRALEKKIGKTVLGVVKSVSTRLVSGKHSALAICEIPEYGNFQLSVKYTDSVRLYPGEQVWLEVSHVNPNTNELQLQVAKKNKK